MGKRVCGAYVTEHLPPRLHSSPVAAFIKLRDSFVRTAWTALLSAIERCVGSASLGPAFPSAPPRLGCALRIRALIPDIIGSRRRLPIRFQAPGFPGAARASGGHLGQRERGTVATATQTETGEIDPVLIEKYNTPGFVGCLSRVQFNGIAPLKAALRSRIAAPVSVQGKLVESNCGASPLTIPPMSAATDPWHLDSAGADFPFNEERVIPDGVNRNSAIIGGVIAVVIFTILCTLVFLIRYMFRHKGTYHTNEAKGTESTDNADAAIIGTDPNFTETIDESKKEWFI
ncbi:hypothetical protein MATL_G00036140 [Megalops atlanticus]|uniref:Neurexin/syndecan/glycophorin C domain-containing protein n=1 Tax=Megalops atlanticus TaxID=7932 RepID=A0A9D3QDR9_MEGAT|nr:hypothetical protein MATL_G00036140 [Megalops atlanticus]